MDISGINSQLSGLGFPPPSRGGNGTSPPPIDEMITKLVQDKDANGDGALSIDEIGISEEAFAKFDVNGDGLLDLDELKAGGRELGDELRTQSLLQDKDADGDGALSIDEIGISEEVFAKVDANGDGLLDLDELKSGMHDIGRALREQGQGPPEGMGENALNMAAAQSAYQEMINALLSSMSDDETSEDDLYSNVYANSISLFA